MFERGDVAVVARRCTPAPSAARRWRAITIPAAVAMSMVCGAEPCGDGHRRAGEFGWDRVAVPAERDQRPCAVTRALDGRSCRERRPAARAQPFASRHGRRPCRAVVDDALAGVEPGHAQPVQRRLGLFDGDVVGQGAPPALRGGVVGLLHDALAVPVPGRADRHLTRRSAWRPPANDRGDPARGRVADGGHPVEAPHPRSARPGRGRSGPGRRSDAAGPSTRRARPRHSPRVRQRADQQERLGRPNPTRAGGSGSSTQSHWVSSPGGCSITATGRSLAGAARLARRAQPPGPDLAGQRLDSSVEARADELVEQRHGPQMRILDQPGTHIVDEPLEPSVAGRGPVRRRRGRRSDTPGSSCGHGPDAGRSPRSSSPSRGARERPHRPPV